MDPHWAIIATPIDYKPDSKDGKPAPATEERLDSGLGSLKEEDYQAVAAEIRKLQLESEPPSLQPQSRELLEWNTHTTEDGDTLLHLAIIHEAKDYIRSMIDLSRNSQFLNTQNDQRQTPLHLAVITNQPDVCRHLLLSGCDPTLVDEGGDTPLHIACLHGNLPCFSMITQTCPPARLGTVMAAYNYRGQNCLHLASVHGFLSLVASLVGLGADVNAKEQRNSRSALHLAVDHQNLSLVQLLLKKGANPNQLTSGGHTPFHLTYGRHDDAIRRELFSVTHPALRELLESESEDSEEEEDDELSYDDIQWNGR